MTNIFPFRPDWVRVVALCIVLLASASVHAEPTNCDDDMTEDQRWQAKLCSSHAGCRLVFGIADSCAQAKSFLSRLGLGGKGSRATLTDSDVSQALIDSGVPQPGLASCTLSFDRTLCRQFLGIEQAPITPPKEEYKPTREQEISRMIRELLDQESRARGRPGLIEYSAARTGLESCAASKEFSDREKACERAQKNVDECNRVREDWNRRKAEVLGELKNNDPKLKVEFASAKPLSSLELPPCPYTLPQTSLSPAQALALWAEEEGKAGNVIARCDAMRRDTSDALDNNELDRASGLIEKLETDCSKQHQTYYDLARLYKQRLAEARAAQQPLTLSRRGDNRGSALFQEAINQAEEDQRDPSARKARERLAQEQQAAAKAQEDQSSRETWKVVSILGKAALAATGGQTSTERMQLAINSLAQPAGEHGTSDLSAEDDADTSSSEEVQGRTGLAMDECLRQENASDIGNKLTALPDSNLNLKMRGTIAACDFMIQTYSKCLPDQRAQQVVNQYKATREQTLRTCRQVSSADNCLESPFGGSVKTDVSRQKIQMQEQDARELQEALETLANTIEQYQQIRQDSKRQAPLPKSSGRACGGIACN